jgi:hypothetical protein
MADYKFETGEFGISDNGIHLLRSRFNYETISFPDIDSLTIEKGKELNNWAVILVIGSALFAFSIYYAITVIITLYEDNYTVFYINHFFYPFIPFMMGSYCIYSSTRNAMVLRVLSIKGKKYKLSLKALEKASQLEDFQKFMKEKLKTKIRINS